MVVLARKIFSFKPAQEAESYPSITPFLMDIYFISAVFQTYPSSTHGTVTSKNPISVKHDRMNTSLVKHSLQTDQANPMLSILFFKHHSVTFSGHLSEPPVVWARSERALPKVQSHRSLLTVPLLKCHRSTLPKKKKKRPFRDLFHKTNTPSN